MDYPPVYNRHMAHELGYNAAQRSYQRQLQAYEQRRQQRQMTVEQLSEQLMVSITTNDLANVQATIQQIRAFGANDVEKRHIFNKKARYTVDNRELRVFQKIPNFSEDITQNLNGPYNLQLDTLGLALVGGNSDIFTTVYRTHPINRFNIGMNDYGELAYSLELWPMMIAMDSILHDNNSLIRTLTDLILSFDDIYYAPFRAKFINCIGFLRASGYPYAQDLIYVDTLLPLIVLYKHDVEFMRELFYLNSFNTDSHRILRVDLAWNRASIARGDIITAMEIAFFDRVKALPQFDGAFSDIYYTIEEQYMKGVMINSSPDTSFIASTLRGNILAFATLTQHMPMIELIANNFIERDKVPLELLYKLRVGDPNTFGRIMVGYSLEVAPEGPIKEYLTEYRIRTHNILPQTGYPVEHLRPLFPAPPAVLPLVDVPHDAIDVISLEELEAGMPLIDFKSEGRPESALGRYYTASSLAQWYDTKREMAARYGRPIASMFINPTTRSIIDPSTIRYYKVGRVLPEPGAAAAPVALAVEPVAGPLPPAAMAAAPIDAPAPVQRRQSPRLAGRAPGPGLAGGKTRRRRKIVKRRRTRIKRN